MSHIHIKGVTALINCILPHNVLTEWTADSDEDRLNSENSDMQECLLWIMQELGVPNDLDLKWCGNISAIQAKLGNFKKNHTEKMCLH